MSEVLSGSGCERGKLGQQTSASMMKNERIFEPWVSFVYNSVAIHCVLRLKCSDIFTMVGEVSDFA